MLSVIADNSTTEQWTKAIVNLPSSIYEMFRRNCPVDFADKLETAFHPDSLFYGFNTWDILHALEEMKSSIARNAVLVYLPNSLFNILEFDEYFCKIANAAKSIKKAREQFILYHSTTLWETVNAEEVKAAAHLAAIWDDGILFLLIVIFKKVRKSQECKFLFNKIDILNPSMTHEEAEYYRNQMDPDEIMTTH